MRPAEWRSALFLPEKEKWTRESPPTCGGDSRRPETRRGRIVKTSRPASRVLFELEKRPPLAYWGNKSRDTKSFES
jgi:hypothetical protein